MKIIFSKEKHTHENKTLRNIILLHAIQKTLRTATVSYSMSEVFLVLLRC